MDYKIASFNDISEYVYHNIRCVEQDDRQRFDVSVHLQHNVDPEDFLIVSQARLHGVISQDFRRIDGVDSMLDLLHIMLTNASKEAEQRNWLFVEFNLKLSSSTHLLKFNEKFWVNDNFPVKRVLEYNAL